MQYNINIYYKGGKYTATDIHGVRELNDAEVIKRVREHGATIHVDTAGSEPMSKSCLKFKD